MERIHELIKQLNVVCCETGIEGHHRIEQLILTLDNLLVEAQQLNLEFDEREYPDPPKRNYAEIRAQIAPNFPKFGLYNCAAEIDGNIGESKLSVGDSIGDIVEILNDLYDISWRFENTSAGDALFYFELGFRSHWGRHARELQLYIHNYYW